MRNSVENLASELEREVAEKERLIREKEAEIERLRHRLRLLEKALFGPRSERLLSDPEGQQGFDQLLKDVEELNKQLQKNEEELQPPAKPQSKRRRRRSLQELIPDDLPEETVVIDVPPEEKICPETGEPLRRIGEDRVRKLAFKPGGYFVKVFVYPKYAAPKKALQGVRRASAPDFAVPGGCFDESLLAHVLVEKGAYHMPLYRQEEKLASAGIEISRQTLSKLYMQGAEALYPVFEAMKKNILARDVIFTDDTPVQLQVKGKRKTITGRMWVYVGGGNGPPYRVFEFTVDRSKKRPMEFLGSYKGYIHADAYKGYDKLFQREGVHECGCWMHVRRKFREAEDAPKELRLEIIRLINGIYRYERALKGKDDDTIVSVRRKRILPLIDRIFDRTRRALTEGDVLPSSSFAKAAAYMHNLGDALKVFLTDARLKPDNGASERALRPLTIGRKNWLFAGSKRGGDATGIILSLIQSCRAMDIEPFTYLEDVLRRINGHNSNRVAELLPHNWKPAENYYS